MNIETHQSLVMVVDDEPENLNVLDALLTLAGFRVVAFPRGELALAAAHHEAPELVLLDVRMPGLNGYEVCRRFKADASLHAIPILFISAQANAENIAAGFACGAVDYIAKPFRAPEVLARVHTHIALRKAYLQLAAEHAQLHRLERHRDMLTHMLVHDMRSPLQVIRGHLELLAGDGAAHLPADARCSLSAATRGVTLLSQMVSTVVDLSRMESTGIPLNRAAVAAADLFRAARAQALEPTSAHRVSQQIAAACPCLLCDVDLSVRVVANLLTNALKYAPADGAIVLGAETHADGVRVWVCNEGPGIPAHSQQRIFEKFGVVDPPSGNPCSSTGLGLAFCRLAVEAHGGSIGVESQPGLGSTFWFTLPADDQH